MDPQHLDRLDDDGTVPSSRAGTAGGFTATVSPESPEVPESAPVDPLRSDAWPLPGPGGLEVGGAATPEDVVAAVAAGRGPRHRAPGRVRRRRTLCLAAALIGAAGLAVTVGSDPSQAAQADEPTSVAQELRLVQAGQPALDVDAAAARLQQQVASRAEREDAEAAAARIQADADRAAVAAAAEAARPQAVLPVQGASISSGFGYRWGTLHAGVDFAAPLGTPEYAAMDGVVLRAGAASGFGLAVYIQHANGDVTVYGHMEQILVVEGQTVKAGDTIALLGNQGQSTGPHLHFEVHLGGMDGERVDPLPWLRDHGVQV